MNKVVFDASAMIAFIKGEPGAEVIEPYLGYIVMSCVNISETVANLRQADMTYEQSINSIEPFVDTIIPFDLDYAYMAAELKQYTARKGLSLGDRACLAVGKKLKIPIYTADKVWSQLQLDDIIIKQIR